MKICIKLYNLSVYYVPFNLFLKRSLLGVKKSQIYLYKCNKM